MSPNNLNDFTRGWVIGDFHPALVQTKDIEVGILELKAGEKGDNHYHLNHEEFNIVITGTVKAKGKLYFEGDIFTYYPGEKSDVEFLEDTKLLVIKHPATKGDKHYD
jgi:quercetin dioxygenase-like cupin family protein